MVTSTNHKIYQRHMKTGNGNILKALRAEKSGWKILITIAIISLVFSLPLALRVLIEDPAHISTYIVFAPGILLLILGIVLKRKRNSDWLSYYQKSTGFSEGELQQINRELSDPSVTLIICQKPTSSADDFIACFLCHRRQFPGRR